MSEFFEKIAAYRLRQKNWAGDITFWQSIVDKHQLFQEHNIKSIIGIHGISMIKASHMPEVDSEALLKFKENLSLHKVVKCFSIKIKIFKN